MGVEFISGGGGRECVEGLGQGCGCEYMVILQRYKNVVGVGRSGDVK